MESQLSYHEMRAALEWQIELGVTEATGETPVNWFELAIDPAPAPKKDTKETAASRPVSKPQDIDPVAIAKELAQGATSLAELEQVIADFDHCVLKKGARNCVFADGLAGADVMIIGEAPGRDEDLQGKPFVGRAGQLLDKMLAAIALDRSAAGVSDAVYITNVLPWRPPQNRDPDANEIAMMTPFVTRHIELAAPKVLILMGNVACQALLGKTGITRQRGKWTQIENRPAMPMFHPAYLLRNPERKREAWADLLEIRAKLGATK